MKAFDIIIETCKGSSAKFAFDPAINRFILKKVLPAGMVFPFDFGYINNTIGEDKQPLDVIMFGEFETFPGCLVKCRIVGGISVQQTEGKDSSKTIQNDRYIAIPMESNLFKDVKSIQDLPKSYIAQLKDFFSNYNNLDDRRLVFGKNITAEAAEKSIEKGKVE